MGKAEMSRMGPKTRIPIHQAPTNCGSFGEMLTGFRSTGTWDKKDPNPMPMIGPMNCTAFTTEMYLQRDYSISVTDDLARAKKNKK